MLKKLLIVTGLWIPITSIILLVIGTYINQKPWRGLNRDLFCFILVVSLIACLGVIFGNMVFKFCYGSREVKLLSFVEGLIIVKKYDYNDLKTIFPSVNRKVWASSQKGNVIFGKWRGKIIAKPLDQQSGHVNVVASSGGGKTTKCIIPTILDILSKNQNGDNSSFMAIDIKGELEAITNKVCKKKGMECRYKVFNPEKADSYGFNPYFILRGIENNDDKIEILEEIAHILIPINSDEKGNAFWLEGARAYLTGALWFAYEYKKLGFVASLQMIAKENPYDFAMQVKMWDDRYINVYFSDIYGYAEKGEKTLNYFYSEVKRNIQLFGINKAIADVFSKPDDMCIEPKDLLDGYNLFLQFSEMKMPIYNKACALIINLFVRYFVGLNESTMSLPNTAWLMDEFAQLPYMPSMDRCISTIRSKGVTLVFCLQEPENQLRGKYGAESAKIFMQNCTYNIIYGITGDSAEYFSREVGEYDRNVKSYTKGEKSRVTISTRKERIIAPQTFRDLKEKDKGVLICPYGYGYIDVIPWYKNKRWM